MPCKLVSWSTPSKLEHDVKGDGELTKQKRQTGEREVRGLIFLAVFAAFQKDAPFYSFMFIWVFSKNRGTPKWMVKILENPY